MRYSIMGAAWGDPIASVDVRIDDGAWQPATLTDRGRRGKCLGLLDTRLGDASAGEHTITSRATSVAGDMQPAPDDPYLAGKTTYWESNGQITRRVQIA